ncbi:MAG TPA: osmotically inducible protein OsmC [bacterium]|nr:osmotically inducible protein OsmC [bacterium]
MEMKIVSPGGKKVNALYKGFTILTDQSKEYGGEESAPEPFDMFLASIGTCAGINVIAFCQKRDIPTEKIKLILDFERNQETKMIERITIEIQLPDEFPEKYKKAVVRTADLCAVKKHLLTPPEFEIFIKS